MNRKQKERRIERIKHGQESNRSWNLEHPAKAEEKREDNIVAHNERVRLRERQAKQQKAKNKAWKKKKYKETKDPRYRA